MNVPKDAPSEMHGPAVASIAVGKTVGVAPGGELFYIAFQRDPRSTLLEGYAQGLRRLLGVNARLPRKSAKSRWICSGVKAIQSTTTSNRKSPKAAAALGEST